MSQLQYPDSGRFWTPRTWFLMLLLGATGIAFLLGLIAVATTNLAH